MKKIILAAVVLVSISSVQASASNHLSTISYSHALRNNSPIPPACVDAYNAMYPGATTLKWARKGEGVYQVTFIFNGQKLTARYSYTGVYLGK
ncbi:hypothetical protein FRZ67_05630 [Panacibacter ginsenosidivorans]|uniref:Uncharacterized protein n=1 Tax=Panacibacter ginsenosidivorans TaxID=1813871 RepID=A0A5B8V5Q5_9BACT|nr:hypothetical protein [Panacibacter ginsenosidivorans]QEC66807.1 hypothetical protein FRZ67_05630 [Panacibacter ginsenosidivorans]